ncbi:hypothetical protein [Streptomyces sp. NPDC057257]|uniref:hypothetical protein n=1 Tax=Streptomyces sp. NPDC057257 TaxID=3346071 RepID=UPI00363C2495
MTYAVTVDVQLPAGSPELDALQREGVAFLLRKGLDSVEAIEGPDGMEVGLTDDLIAVHPGGAILKLFVDAPALEFAEEAAGEVVAELLERSELLGEWEIARCEVDLHPDLLQESLDAADGPDAPPADLAERARRHRAGAPPVAPHRLDHSEVEAMRDRLRSLAPALKAFPLEAFGHSETDGTVGRQAAEVAAGAVVHSIDLLVDGLFTDLAGLEEDGPTVADSDAAFMILDDLPPQFAVHYTALFARRLTATAVTMTGRLTQPHFGGLSCVAEELLMRFLLAQAEVTTDLYGLLTEEVGTALETFANGLYSYEDTDPESKAEDWFTPFDAGRCVHPYAANDD